MFGRALDAAGEESKPFGLYNVDTIDVASEESEQCGGRPMADRTANPNCLSRRCAMCSQVGTLFLP
jgi:hypothetical protein